MKAEYKRTGYSSDPTDEQWNRILSVQYFTAVRNRKEYEKKLCGFLVKETRIKAEKDVELSYALIDLQSVKTAR